MSTPESLLPLRSRKPPAGSGAVISYIRGLDSCLSSPLTWNGTVTSTAFDERRAINVALRIDGRNVPQAKLNVPGVGNVTLTGTWVPPAQVTNPDGSKSDVPGDAGYTRFDWDASAVAQPTQPNGPSLLSYTLTAQDSSGVSALAKLDGRIFRFVDGPWRDGLTTV